MKIYLDLTTCGLCNQKPTQEFIWVELLWGGISILKLCNECSKKFKQLDWNNQKEIFKGKRGFV